MLLAEWGEKKLSRMLNHQLEMGHYLRELLAENGWKIVNESPLPVVCFKHQDKEVAMEKILNSVLERKKTWLSKVDYNGESILRACVCSYKTKKEHIRLFVEELNVALATCYTLTEVY